MHTDAFGRLKVQVRLHRLRRIHVNGLHEPARLVGADGQERQINRTEPQPNVVEEARIRGVAGEKDARAACRPASYDCKACLGHPHGLGYVFAGRGTMYSGAAGYRAARQARR